MWLGTGENASQRSAHFGDGVYKSTDAGKTWKHVGLAASEHIGKIVIDPKNTNIVYVASQGPLWSAGGDRGLYKTTDGGADVAADPEDQRRHRRQRRRDGSEEPARALRLGLPAAPGRRTDDRRRAGGRDSQDGGWRQDLEEADEWPAQGRHGARGPGDRRAEDAGDGVCHHRRQARRGGLLPVGRCRCHMGAHREDGAGCRRTAWRRRGPGSPGGASGSAGCRASRGGSGRRPARAGRGIGGPGGAPGRGARRRGRQLVSRRRRRVLPRDLRGSVQARHALVDEHEHRTQHRRRQDLGQGELGERRRARRPPRPRVGSHRQKPPPARQRRRTLRVVRRRRDVAVLREPAGHAVLPRVHRQREALLQRLRRHPGQLVALRAVALAQPLGRPYQRLVHRGRRRWLPDAQRPERPDHRLRPVAGRQRVALRREDGRLAFDPPADGAADARRWR